MIELKQFTNVEELYNRRREPTGELIIDAVIEALRFTKTTRSDDIALFIGVSAYALRSAVQMLTGITLKDFVLRWRLLQAKELWDEKLAGFTNYNDFVKTKNQEAPEGYQLTREMKRAYQNEISIKSLEEVANRCGWDSYKSLLRTGKKFGISFAVKRFVKS